MFLVGSWWHSWASGVPFICTPDSAWAWPASSPAHSRHSVNPVRMFTERKEDNSWHRGAMQQKWLSHVRLFVTPWTVAHQAPLSMGILQARILEWVAMPSSRGSSRPRNWTYVSCLMGRFFTIWAIWEAHAGRGMGLFRLKYIRVPEDSEGEGRSSHLCRHSAWPHPGSHCWPGAPGPTQSVPGTCVGDLPASHHCRQMYGYSGDSGSSSPQEFYAYWPCSSWEGGIWQTVWRSQQPTQSWQYLSKFPFPLPQA